MKRILLIVALVASCSMGNDEIIKAGELCKRNDGLSHIYVRKGVFMAEAYCNNGARFYLEE